MKKTLIALVAAAALASTAAASQATKPAETPKTAKQTTATKPAATKEAKPAAKVTAMAAEVVSVDAAAKTVTVKGADGTNQTLTATGNAVAQLAKVSAGEKVHLMVEGTNVSKITRANGKTAAKGKK